MHQFAGQKHTYLYTRLATYAGFGGPATTTNANSKHPATATRAGRFTINFIGPHTTAQTGPDAYIWSAVPWGTPLRLDRKLGIQIRLPGKEWQRLTSLPAWRSRDGDQAAVTQQVITRYLQLWRSVLPAIQQAHLVKSAQLYQEIPAKWVFNDFGHLSVKYYRDANHNGRQDHTPAEGTLSDFIHTTPDHELVNWLNEASSAGLTMPLGESHGCVHTLPAEVDEMVQSGYLRVGGTFVVHRYDERSQGSFEEVTTQIRTTHYELHFFPGEKKLVAYMMTKLS